MSTAAQIAANQANSQHSTGPQSAKGKATVSSNAVRHGLVGKFLFLPGESAEEFHKLQEGLRAEHSPATPTETLLIENMAQHYWLQQRAIRLQGRCFDEAGACNAEKELALYLRYHTTHERAFYKSLNTLLKLRAEKRKAGLDEAALCQRAEDSKIGFVSQNRAREQAELNQNRESRQAAVEARRQAVEKRRQELHKWHVLLAQAKVDNQELQNMKLETPEHHIEGRIRRIIEAEKAA